MLLSLWALLLALSLAPAARAHTTPGSVTLSERVLVADVVVLATVEPVRGPDTAPGDRPLAQATIVERFRGEVPAGPLRFELHSHAGEGYPEGEKVVLFLRRRDAKEKARSISEYVSVDDVSDRVSLGRPGSERPSAAQVLAAVRSYSEALAAGAEMERAALRKRATLSLLGSKDARLQASALRDLAQGSVGLGAEDAGPLLSIADDLQVAMSARVLLLDELARRGLADPAPRYLRWLDQASTADMAPLVRAMGRRDDPALRRALVARLGDADDERAALAARALGEPFHGAAAPALGALAAADGRPKAARAAIESLGRMGTSGAQRALEELLNTAPDPERRRAIQTMLNRMAQRAPAPSASAPGAASEAGQAAPSPPLETSAGTPAWRSLWGALRIVAAVGAAAAAATWMRRRARGAP